MLIFRGVHIITPRSFGVDRNPRDPWVFPTHLMDPVAGCPIGLSQTLEKNTTPIFSLRVFWKNDHPSLREIYFGGGHPRGDHRR